MEQLSTSGSERAAPISTSQHAGEYLGFKLGAEEYGIDILKVQEIRGFESPTRMVSTPDYVLGVLNLRGVIVPILDMRIQFGMADVAYGPQTVTIVLNVADRVVGMVVDAVSDVVPLLPDDIKPAPDLRGDTVTQYVIGIAALTQDDTHRMLILLDIEQLMRSDGMGLVSQSVQ
jgi:purine-binding chemotaxis protein CheW